MSLFDQRLDPPQQVLPCDGCAEYYGVVIDAAEADRYLQRLLSSIDWQHDEAVIMGKRITTRRMVAWHGDKHFRYTYSQVTKQALPWTPELSALKQRVEAETGERFNACLLNLYHDGSEAMAWHSDAERDLKRHAAIASLSFGAERKFAFKHKLTKQTVSLLLQHGGLLVMKGVTQEHWLHRLPPTTKVSDVRLNLTFRTMLDD